MQKNKLAKIAVATFSAGTLVASMIVPAFAESTENGHPLRNNLPVETKLKNLNERFSSRSTELREKLGSRSAQFQNKMGSKSADIAARCEKISQHIIEVQTKAKANKEQKSNQFSNISTRVQELITKLKAKGVNTTKLETDLVILNTKVQKAKIDYDTYIANLGASNQYTCGNSTGQFATNLELARKAMNLVHQDNLDIRNFYQTTLKNDLHEIRTTLRNTHHEANDSGRSKHSPLPSTSAHPTASSSAEVEQ